MKNGKEKPPPLPDKDDQVKKDNTNNNSQPPMINAKELRALDERFTRSLHCYPNDCHDVIMSHIPMIFGVPHHPVTTITCLSDWNSQWMIPYNELIEITPKVFFHFFYSFFHFTLLH